MPSKPGRPGPLPPRLKCVAQLVQDERDEVDDHRRSSASEPLGRSRACLRLLCQARCWDSSNFLISGFVLLLVVRFVQPSRGAPAPLRERMVGDLLQGEPVIFSPDTIDEGLAAVSEGRPRGSCSTAPLKRRTYRRPEPMQPEPVLPSSGSVSVF